MDATESDHKPVRCKFNVDIARIDRSVRRQEFGKVIELNDAIRRNLEALRFVPETTVSSNRITLQKQDNFNLKITNRRGEEMVFFRITCGGQSTFSEDEISSSYHPRCTLGSPRWLQVTPAVGMISPYQVAEVSIHHEEFHTLDGIPQSWWSEDTRDKEVILLVNVRGSCSTESEIHCIYVRHCFSGNAVSQDQRTNSARKHGGSSHHRPAQM